MTRLDLFPRQIRHDLLHPPRKILAQHEILRSLDEEARLFDSIALVCGERTFVFPVGLAGAVPVTGAFEAGFDELADVVF